MQDYRFSRDSLPDILTLFCNFREEIVLINVWDVQSSKIAGRGVGIKNVAQAEPYEGWY